MPIKTTWTEGEQAGHVELTALSKQAAGVCEPLGLAADLNAYSTAGTYFITTNGSTLHAPTYPNAWTGYTLHLAVYREGSWVQQIAWTADLARMAMRRSADGGTTWTSWGVHLASDEDAEIAMVSAPVDMDALTTATGDRLLLSTGSTANLPSGWDGRALILEVWRLGTFTVQRVTSVDLGDMAVRRYDGSSWGSWHVSAFT